MTCTLRNGFNARLVPLIHIAEFVVNGDTTFGAKRIAIATNYCWLL